MYRSLVLMTALLWAALLPTRLPAQHSPSGAALSGTVEDAVTGEPLVGVSLLVQGTTLGTVTDRDGRFTLAPADRIIVVHYIGYATARVDPATAPRPLVIRLEPRLVDLQPVVVSASREVEARTAQPIAIAALSAEQLRTARANALHELLDKLPGVHMTDLGNEQHNMSIRQPLSYKALYAYLEDGISIRPTGVFNHHALIEVNMAGVERVEVVRGPASSLYGPNAVGGAVNFITPRPSHDPFAGISFRTDNYGYRRADVTASATTGKLGLWAGGYAARRRNGWSEHSDFGKQSLTLRADYAFEPTTRLATTLTTNRLNTDTNGSLDSLNFYGRGFTSLQTFTYRDVEATRLTSRLDHVWNRHNSTDIAVFYRHNSIGQLPHYRIRNVSGDPSRALGEENEDRFHSLGFNVQHQLYLEVLQARMIAGGGVDRSPNSYVAHFVEIDRDPQTRRYVRYTLRDSLLTNYDVDLLNSAVYLQFEASPLARLRLVGSLRYDRIDYAYDNHLPPSAFSGAPDEQNGFHRLSPRVGLTYDLERGRGLYANFSQGFLPPEVGELYRGVKVPALRPSFFNSYEGGGWAQCAGGRIQADVSVYRMDGADEIISVQLEDGSSVNRNAGRTRHIGVEYGLALMPLRDLTLRLSGANARHEFVRYEEGADRLDGNRMDGAPGWIANAEVQYRPPFVPGSRIGLEWQHVGRYYMDTRNTVRYGGYDLLHLRAGYTFLGVEVWANMLNLSDELYATIASRSRFGYQYTAGVPRNISFGVGYTFGERNL